MKLPSFVCKVLEELKAHGHTAFVVGGCVRDMILGNEPKDWDVATSATPQDMLKIFDRVIPTGISHGTVTVLTEKEPVEITTFRIEEEYSDFRHPGKVTFSEDLNDDLKRRDFTINAMAYNPERGLCDPFCGRQDIEKRIIRSVGDPKERFLEDALRIMRALRFSAVLGFGIEKATEREILLNSALLENISKERISGELSKIIMADDPKEVLVKYKKVFEEILGVKVQEDLWENAVRALVNAKKVLSLRLSLLLYGQGEEKTEEILRNLKIDSKTIKEAKTISRYLRISLAKEPYLIKKELSQLGEEMFSLVLSAKKAVDGETHIDILKTEEVFREIISKNECYSLKDLKVKGDDLKTSFGLEGKELGDILSKVFDAVLLGECKNEKDEILNYAKEHILKA